MNIENMTTDQLRDLLTQIDLLIQQRRAQELADDEQLRADIGEAVATLDGLLGPADGDPGVDSIRAVRRYDAQTMGENAGLALSLAFEALEILTATTRDIATVAATAIK